MKLLFGSAGIPLSTQERNTANGIARVRELGLDAMELEFVHSVNISEAKTNEIRAAAKKSSVTLTCHAPYYINLNANPQMIDASINRLLLAARRASQCSAWSVCFHAGFYLLDEKNVVYDRIRNRLKVISKTLINEGHNIWIRPEISGKPSQFGSLEELVALSDIEHVNPCIDFAHMHARTNGKYNTYEEFASILDQIEKINGLKEMHIHTAGISYGPKGERKHLTLKESDLNYKDLVKSWKDYKIGGVVISESPNVEEDALLLKKAFKND